MNERLRIKPILIGWLVSFVGATIAGIVVAVYSTGGDMMKLQKFGEEMSTTTQIALSLFGAFFAMAGGYVAVRMAPFDPSRHVKRLALVVVVIGAIGLVIGMATQGVGMQTVIGGVATAANYGAVILGGYLGTDDEATA
ncbi:hypothetical protein HN371_14665 [Candidatus Poribacteria bacterium]|jgi:hypothetical protein|nr:hypothetical protein [Candidatus Poribacteria bacterium]MBT5532032.1 hypothetical protein [Candidatus Poribacteria bacterium]MBT5711601.1 hypothetical protein [Candidatus Poribacteria bacterium]MBT7806976.1 hypothetical protein [Candidatus Poribacteria bacterium]